MNPNLLALGLAAVLASGPALAVPPTKQADGSAPVSVQDDPAAFLNDPHIHAFYELTKAAFAHGADAVDKVKYYRDSMVLFREFALSHHMDPKHVQDHMKLIPGQMVKIVKDDPAVLASYEAFSIAMVGPP